MLRAECALAYAAARHLYGEGPMSDTKKELSLPEPVELTDAELDQVCGGVGTTPKQAAADPRSTDADLTLRQIIYLQQRHGSGSVVPVRAA